MNILDKLKTVSVPKKAIVTAGITMLLAVLIIGLALLERQSRVQAESRLAAAEQAERAESEQIRLIHELEVASNDKTARLTAVCGYVTGLSQNKAIRPPVVVPAACK